MLVGGVRSGREHVWPDDASGDAMEERVNTDNSSHPHTHVANMPIFCTLCLFGWRDLVCLWDPYPESWDPYRIQKPAFSFTCSLKLRVVRGLHHVRFRDKK